MPTPYIALAPAGRKLYLWDFSYVNNRHCMMCNACHAEYAEDALRAMAAHEALKNGTYKNGIVRDLHVYCCSTPPSTLPTDVIMRISPPGRNAAGFIPSLAVPKLPAHVPEPEPQSDEPDAEREAPAVCRWCKNKRVITVNFKTKPCKDCARGDGTIRSEDIRRDWKVKKTFHVSA